MDVVCVPHVITTPCHHRKRGHTRVIIRPESASVISGARFSAVQKHRFTLRSTSLSTHAVQHGPAYTKQRKHIYGTHHYCCSLVRFFTTRGPRGVFSGARRKPPPPNIDAIGSISVPSSSPQSARDHLTLFAGAILYAISRHRLNTCATRVCVCRLRLPP